MPDNYEGTRLRPWAWPLAGRIGAVGYSQTREGGVKGIPPRCTPPFNTEGPRSSMCTSPTKGPVGGRGGKGKLLGLLPYSPPQLHRTVSGTVSGKPTPHRWPSSWDRFMTVASSCPAHISDYLFHTPILLCCAVAFQRPQSPAVISPPLDIIHPGLQILSNQQPEGGGGAGAEQGCIRREEAFAFSSPGR